MRQQGSRGKRLHLTVVTTFQRSGTTFSLGDLWPVLGLLVSRNSSLQLASTYTPHEMPQRGWKLLRARNPFRAWACKIAHVSVCARCSPLHFQEDKPSNRWEAGPIIAHFTDKKTDLQPDLVMVILLERSQEWISATCFPSLHF